MSDKTLITVARGDGIGPEIMDACLRIMDAAGANLEYDEVQVGEKVYLEGNTSGIDEKLWDSIRNTKVIYKAPLTTPQGKGLKSVNVTMRKTLGLFANVRPCKAYTPFVRSKYPNMDLVVVRENEEDLYAGIEHRQTDEVYQTLKLVSRPGCERIARYAFEYARSNGRKKVSCFAKDNIMKLTDGLFHKVFDEVGKEYSDIEQDFWIVDIGTARVADTPERFDVIVIPNLYGDILSDVTAQISGSVGLCGSANIGEHAAMFEAVHGSAPDIAGKNLANPSGLLHAGVMLLRHLGKHDVASKVLNAWFCAIEDGQHTTDVYRNDMSKKLLGTKEFADAVVERMGNSPKTFRPAAFEAQEPTKISKLAPREPQARELQGVDIFLNWSDGDRNPDQLGEQLSKANTEKLELIMITNRGQSVWPGGHPETFCTDHWRCRFKAKEGQSLAGRDIVELMGRVLDNELDIIKSENLYNYDGQPGYSLGQGQ